MLRTPSGEFSLRMYCNWPLSSKIQHKDSGQSPPSKRHLANGSLAERSQQKPCVWDCLLLIAAKVHRTLSGEFSLQIDCNWLWSSEEIWSLSGYCKQATNKFTQRSQQETSVPGRLKIFHILDGCSSLERCPEHFQVTSLVKLSAIGHDPPRTSQDFWARARKKSPGCANEKVRQNSKRERYLATDQFKRRSQQGACVLDRWKSSLRKYPEHSQKGSLFKLTTIDHGLQRKSEDFLARARKKTLWWANGEVLQNL